MMRGFLLAFTVCPVIFRESEPGFNPSLFFQYIQRFCHDLAGCQAKIFIQNLIGRGGAKVTYREDYTMSTDESVPALGTTGFYGNPGCHFGR